MNVLFLKNGDARNCPRPLEPVRRDWFAAETCPPSPVFFTAFTSVPAFSAPADKVVQRIPQGR
jgi:hypothetical protein